jgi:hypothetical protein
MSGSTSSLPSLSVKSEKLLMNYDDFSGSIPMFHNRKVAIWGDNIAPISKYNIFRAAEEEKISHDLNISQIEKTESQHSNLNSEHSKRNSKVRKSSLLGMGYKYMSFSDILVVPPKEPKEEKSDSTSRVSKHSTTNRKLRPEKASTKSTRKTPMTEEEASPLPKVQMRNHGVAERRLALVAERRNCRKRSIITQKASLKDIGYDLVSVIGQGATEKIFDNGEVWEQYFGTESRQQFYDRYKETKRQANT